MRHRRLEKFGGVAGEQLYAVIHRKRRARGLARNATHRGKRTLDRVKCRHHMRFAARE